MFALAARFVRLHLSSEERKTFFPRIVCVPIEYSEVHTTIRHRGCNTTHAIFANRLEYQVLGVADVICEIQRLPSSNLLAARTVAGRYPASYSGF
ncbi:hypothetical protein CYMTET_4805 [Cymbomonas tetramitiformis]|uniref:Uncharacterized protein n=1 Tax=Cymbomonas tetramitiformis TaxID=36881 RepID=A0AAE0LJQ0_9CHLO|nr:hypothetical protein CYMTET_4805 [Cymbomonas tetramitiformis]